jgi:hypothetical protein
MRSSRFISLLVLTAGLALWTLAPYGGCACYNPMGASSGPTLTPTATHGPVVADFADAPVAASAGTYINHWNGSSLDSVDTLGVSAMTSTFVAAGQDGNPALRFSGQYGYGGTSHGCLVGPPASGSTYPYVAYRMYLNPNGAGGDENVSITILGGATGLRFWAYQAATPANTLRVKCILKSLADYASANQCAANAYAYHLKDLPSVANTWTQYSIPFNQFVFPSWATGVINGVNYAVNGQDLTKPACRTAGDLYLMAVQFEPLNPTTYPGTKTFDFYIDNVEFY